MIKYVPSRTFKSGKYIKIIRFSRYSLETLIIEHYLGQWKVRISDSKNRSNKWNGIIEYKKLILKINRSKFDKNFIPLSHCYFKPFQQSLAYSCILQFEMILFHFCSAKFVALFTLRNPNLTNLPKFQSDPLSSGWNSL